MIASTKEEYAFKVIDPAYVPKKKIKPFRALIMVVATALSGIFGVTIIFVNSMLQNQRKAFQEHIHGLFRRISANVNASKDKVKDRIDLV